MDSEEYLKKLTRMRTLERERQQRIFNEKQRIIGVDKKALDEQVKERKFYEQQLRREEEMMQKALIEFSNRALEQEQLLKRLNYRDAECQRQLQNMLLAREQKSRNNRVNQETLLNVPTEDYYNYFNRSSR